MPQTKRGRARVILLGLVSALCLSTMFGGNHPPALAQARYTEDDLRRATADRERDDNTRDLAEQVKTNRETLQRQWTMLQAQQKDIHQIQVDIAGRGTGVNWVNGTELTGLIGLFGLHLRRRKPGAEED